MANLMSGFFFGQGVVGQQEADGHDDVALGVHHRLDVLGEVGGGGGLDLTGGDAELVLGVGQALVRGLVERLVVEATGVGDHAALEVTRGGAGAPTRGGRGAAALGARRLRAAGQGQGGGGSGGAQPQERLLHSSLLGMGDETICCPAYS